MRVRLLAALAAATLVMGVLPASAQDANDSQGALDDGLPTDGLGDLGGADSGTDTQQGAGDLPDTQQGARFIATADGGALDIRLSGESLTVGHSEVGIQSADSGTACDQALACARASGEALIGEKAQASTSSGAASDSAAALELNELDPLLDASVGTASADALASDNTSAEAQGGILKAEVSLTEGLLSDSSRDDMTDELNNLLNSTEGVSGGSGAGTPVNVLSGQLDPMLDNLDTDQIQGILSGSGPSSASTAETASLQGSPMQLAEQLLDANATAGDSGNSQDSGGLTAAPEDLLDGVTGGSDADANADANAETDTPSTDDIASLIEGAQGDSGATSPTEPGGLNQDLTGVVQDLLDDLTSRPLASVQVGPTSSAALDDGDATTASTSSQGAVVVILPTEDSTRQNPEGLATVQVGDASASVSSDRETADANFDPAVARLSLGGALLDGGTEDITVRPGQSECVGTQPLQLCVSVGDGNTTVSGSGASASANAVSIQALGGTLPELSVDLAGASTGVNAAPAAQVEPQEEPQQPQEPTVEPVGQELPDTGGGALVPGLLLLGAGGAGFAGLRRMR